MRASAARVELEVRADAHGVVPGDRIDLRLPESQPFRLERTDVGYDLWCGAQRVGTVEEIEVDHETDGLWPPLLCRIVAQVDSPTGTPRSC